MIFYSQKMEINVNDIHLFIRNPLEYSRGVSIYNQFGKSQMLKDNFAKFNNSFWREKLITELKLLALEYPEQKPVLSNKTKRVTQTVVNDKSDGSNSIKKQRPFIDISKLPDDLKAKFVENGDLARNAEFLKRTLHGAPPKDRFDILTRIAEAHEKQMSNWEDIDYFEEHKKKREVTVISKDDKRLVERIPSGNLVGRYNSYMSQRSKLKKSTNLADQDKVKDLTIKIGLLKKQIWPEK